jgi:hypothetical protein
MDAEGNFTYGQYERTLQAMKMTRTLPIQDGVLNG